MTGRDTDASHVGLVRAKRRRRDQEKGTVTRKGGAETPGDRGVRMCNDCRRLAHRPHTDCAQTVAGAEGISTYKGAPTA